MNLFKIGTVTHFYDKLEVAVVQLTADLAVGEKIRFVRGGEDMFEQKVASIQVEHKKVDSAKSGDVVGLKTDEKVREGTEVFRLS